MTRIGPRTAKLLREAIVLAYVEGTRCPAEPGVPFPKDSEIVSLVLASSVGFRDLYPTLSRLDEAKAADAERRQQAIEWINHLMAQTKEQQT
jgi:hypothetical protein